jgi:hypothetical protein
MLSYEKSTRKVHMHDDQHIIHKKNKELKHTKLTYSNENVIMEKMYGFDSHNEIQLMIVTQNLILFHIASFVFFGRTSENQVRLKDCAYL